MLIPDVLIRHSCGIDDFRYLLPYSKLLSYNSQEIQKMVFSYSAFDLSLRKPLEFIHSEDLKLTQNKQTGLQFLWCVTGEFVC